MNDYIIAHAAHTIRTRLQQAARQAEDAATMHMIARAMRNLEAAQTALAHPVIELVACYPDGAPKTLITHPWGGAERVVTTIGCRDHDQAWTCTCGDEDAYQAACSHKFAGRILHEVWAATVWQGERIARRVALADAFEAEAVAIRAAQAAKIVYDQALEAADCACLARLTAQQAVWRDDAEARTRGLADPDDDGPATTLLARVAA